MITLCCSIAVISWLVVVMHGFWMDILVGLRVINIVNVSNKKNNNLFFLNKRSVHTIGTQKKKPAAIIGV